MMGKDLPLLLLIILLFPSSFALTVSRISTLTSTVPGSGMDGGGFFSFFSSGGEFSVMLCSGLDSRPRCCRTDVLDNDDNKSNSEVYITSSYKASHVSDCSYLLERSRLTCHSEMVRPTDFLKLSLFSKFGKGGPL